MGLFDFLFGNRKEPRGEYKGSFKMLNAYDGASLIIVDNDTLYNAK